MTQEVKMIYTKNTKRTTVYSSDEESCAIKTVYIQSECLPKNPPKEITITIDYEE